MPEGWLTGRFPMPHPFRRTTLRMLAMKRLLPASLGCVVAIVLILGGAAALRRERAADPAGWRAERLIAFRRWQSDPSRQGIAVAAVSAPSQAFGHAAGMPPAEVWDAPEAPLLVVVPPGEFLLGSPEEEEGRFPDESPRRRIVLRDPVAVGKYPVTRGEYARFVADAGYAARTECQGYAGETELQRKWRFSWRDPGFPQTDREPAVCIGWNDAKAYVAWLSARTGRRYRLPSEAEWEYAARGGTVTARWWGEGADDGCDAANGADLTAKDRFTDWTVANCRDGYRFTAPVGAFRPNGFGLYDTLGNVWQWVEDCFNDGYDDEPPDGAPRLTGDCRRRMMRGGAWHSHPRYLRSASRRSGLAGVGVAAYGFRVARDIRDPRPDSR